MSTHSAVNASTVHPRFHLLIPTHTTRHLEPCLCAISRQTLPPATIVLTCDSDDPAIREVAERSARAISEAFHARNLEPPLFLHIFRPHQGPPRLNQVRNNGLRALESAGRLSPLDFILILDGDTILEREGIAKHLRLAATHIGAILPYRINLDDLRTARVESARLLQGDPTLESDLITETDRADLLKRQQRMNRQLTLRSSPLRFLIKSHKPKLLGGHHAVRVDLLRAVNGFDEHYRGDGTDDDDLARRLYQLRPRIKVIPAATEVMAFHLYHETRRPWRPSEAPDHDRFARKNIPTFAKDGWTTPLPQPTPTLQILSSAAPVS